MFQFIRDEPAIDDKFGRTAARNRSAIRIFSRLPLGALAFEVPAAFGLHFDVQDFQDDDFVRGGISYPPSIARAVPKRRAEFLAGRQCAARALCNWGCRVSDLPIGPDRAPVWPAGFLGSITHTRTVAAAVAAPTGGMRGIGIDIEHVAADAAIDALDATVIVEAERDLVGTLAQSMGYAAALTLAFSAKESFFKATAKAAGRVFDFHAVQIVDAPHPGLLELELAECLGVDLPRGRRIQASVTHLDEHTLMTACVW